MSDRRSKKYQALVKEDEKHHRPFYYVKQEDGLFAVRIRRDGTSQGIEGWYATKEEAEAVAERENNKA